MTQKDEKALALSLQEMSPLEEDKYSLFKNFHELKSDEDALNFLKSVTNLKDLINKVEFLQNNTLISLATKKGYKETVEYLLKQGAEISRISIDNGYDRSDSPLQQALYEKHCNIAKILLDHGANPNEDYGYNVTPLSIAISKQNVELIDLLIEYKAKAKNGGTILHEIVDNYSFKKAFFDLMFQKFPDSINKQDNDGNTVLHIAATYYNTLYEQIDYLIEIKDINLTLKNKKGETFLDLAQNKRKEDVKKFLQKYVIENPENVKTATINKLLEKHQSDRTIDDLYKKMDNIWSNNDDNVLPFLQDTKNLSELINNEKSNSSEKTLLVIAIEKKLSKTIKFLLELGVDPNQKFGCKTPVQFVIDNDDIDTIEALLQKGADLSDALYHAVSRNKLNIVEFLFQKPAIDINQEGQNKQTLLHIAAESGHKEICDILCAQEGIDIDKADKFGKTPLYLAIANGHKEIAKILQEKGAKTDELFYISTRDNFYDPDKNVIKYILDNKLFDPNKILDDSIIEKYEPYLKGKYQGNIPLIVAILNSDMKTIEILFDHDANIDQQNRNGETALNSIMSGYEYSAQDILMIKKLLEKNADVNIADNKGRLPLKYAIYKRSQNFEIIELLLQKGANISDKNQKGYVPLESARDQEYLNDELKNLLAKYKKDIRQMDNLNDTSDSPTLLPSEQSPENDNENDNIPDVKNKIEDNSVQLQSDKTQQEIKSVTHKRNGLIILSALSGMLGVSAAATYFIPKLKNALATTLGEFGKKHLGKLLLALGVITVPVCAFTLYKANQQHKNISKLTTEAAAFDRNSSLQKY